jgi:hypothetical protein
MRPRATEIDALERIGAPGKRVILERIKRGTKPRRERRDRGIGQRRERIVAARRKEESRNGEWTSSGCTERPEECAARGRSDLLR